MSDMSAFPVGISHKSRDNFGSPSPNPFGDHDYYASSDDDDGARVVKREPWSPSMSPEQNNYMDEDVSNLGSGIFTNLLLYICLHNFKDVLLSKKYINEFS